MRVTIPQVSWYLACFGFIIAFITYRPCKLLIKNELGEGNLITSDLDDISKSYLSRQHNFHSVK